MNYLYLKLHNRGFWFFESFQPFFLFFSFFKPSGFNGRTGGFHERTAKEPMVIGWVGPWTSWFFGLLKKSPS
jgi:hypothetical protein